MVTCHYIALHTRYHILGEDGDHTLCFIPDMIWKKFVMTLSHLELSSVPETLTDPVM